MNEIYDIENSDNSNYGKLSNKINISDDAPLDIKMQSSDKTAKKDVDKKDSFSFDIIDL